MKKGDKVHSITKDNYKEVVDRATALREKLKAHHQEHNGFPSLRFIILKWGYEMSLKALCRHRTAVMKELGLSNVGKPTHVLPRPKRKPKSAAPATATAPAKSTKERVEEPASEE